MRACSWPTLLLPQATAALGSLVCCAVSSSARSVQCCEFYSFFSTAGGPFIGNCVLSDGMQVRVDVTGG